MGDNTLHASLVELSKSLIYEYTPLDPDRREIRVLIIHRAEASSPISCSVLPVSLDDHPEYAALSYV
jgi:hypothetical protein